MVWPVTHLTGCLYWESFPEVSVIPGPLGIWEHKEMNHSYHSPSSRNWKRALPSVPRTRRERDPGSQQPRSRSDPCAPVALEDTLAASALAGPPVGPPAGAILSEGQAGHVSFLDRVSPAWVDLLRPSEALPATRSSLTASAAWCGASSSCSPRASTQGLQKPPDLQGGEQRRARET